MTEGNYSNVGHRGPVYKGLGSMNPCDLSNPVVTKYGMKYMACRMPREDEKCTQNLEQNSKKKKKPF
jgi:hypothetical protein